MNLLKFLQTGGFPADINVLDNMQKAYQLFNGLGALVGDLSIIKGCELSGNTVSNGVVYINGEVLEFRSGIVSDNVVIVEETQTAAFENAELHEVHYTRYATFGVATTSYPWANFKRAFPTKEIAGALAQKLDASAMTAILNRIATLEAKNAVFQAGGGMVLWNKPVGQIPTGWAEVVNWRGRIPIGWNPDDIDFSTIGKTGGAKDHQMTINEMPSHSHSYTSSYEDDGNPGTGLEVGSQEKLYNQVGGINATGGNQPFTIMNPYRVVLFIEYVG
jgi:hypothetical protein